MTTENLAKAKEIMIEEKFLPNDIDFETKLKLEDVRYANYPYWNRYDERYDNSAIGLKFSHCDVEESFWIVIFQGAQEKSEIKEFVTVCWNNLCIDSPIYEYEDDSISENKIVSNIVQKFEFHWFTEDEGSGIEPLTNYDPYSLEYFVNRMFQLEHISLEVTIKRDKIKRDDIKKIKEALIMATTAYEEKISKNLLVEMLEDNICPEEFKSFVKENKISSVRFVNDTLNEDYMPDWAHLITFEDENQNEWAFVQTCSESYDENTEYTGEIYFHNEDIDSKIFMYVQTYYMRIYQEFNI